MQRHAWLLVLNDQQPLVIAREQVVEYVGAHDCHWVPDCAQRCSHVVLWRNQVVAVLGLEQQASLCQHLLVVAHPGGVIALALARQPQSIVVMDQDQCAATAELQEYWRNGILACIQTQGQVLPIVDFGRLGENPV